MPAILIKNRLLINCDRASLLIIFIIFCILFVSCAKIENPSGGPPDKTQPEILFTSPSNGSVKIANDSKIEIQFSKNMNPDLTQKAIFISPIFFDYPTFKWSGKKLTVSLPEKLKQNTTYVLTIGAAAQDSKGNKLGQTKSYAFSTGEIIHSGSIFGKIAGGGQRSLDVWAYNLQSISLDSFIYNIPEYITQTDSLGKFKFQYMSDGRYLVVAVDDRNKDQFWTPPAEKLALPSKIVANKTIIRHAFASI